MKDDLNKAERKLAQRKLFAPQPRRQGRRLVLILLLAGLLLMISLAADDISFSLIALT